jgi:hypothetical protein
MKLKYYYDNGKVTEHTTYVGKKTILREKENATKVSIYKVHTRFGEEVEKYSTTLSLN